MENLQAADKSTDEVFGARVRKHLDDSYKAMPIRREIEKIIDEQTAGKPLPMKPTTIMRIAHEIDGYLRNQGFQSDFRHIYSGINWVQKQVELER